MPQYRILRDGLGAARQLEKEIVGACRASLEPGQRRLDSIASVEEWEQYRQTLMKTFVGAFPDALSRRAPIRPRFVSRADFDGFYVENVIFCSLPGWEVNASVYHPYGDGPFPGVVCPTGHSSKFGGNYVNSAQVFARNGYIAVSFCPPGAGGELSRLNDHFENGIIGWLVGFWCQTHFVADALACVDYLAQRGDVDATKGFAMTGVSGGGLTTIYASACDQRITFAAPVCCVSEQEDLHLQGLYTSCPEQHGPDYIGEGVDQTHLLALTAPRPLVIVGGKLDGLFNYRETEKVYRKLQRIYRLYGREDDVELYIQEDSPHAYTVKMANRVVQAMNRVFYPGKAPLSLTDADMARPEREQLACHPVCPVNMFTLYRDIARRLQAERPLLTGGALKTRLRALLRMDHIQINLQSASEKPEAEMRRYEGYYFQDVVIRHNQDKVIPGVMHYQIGSRGLPGVMYIDEAGKWNAYGHNGPLSVVSGIARSLPPDGKRNTLSVDVSGFGELEANAAMWDWAGWNDINRILSYLSIAQGTPVLAYQVRDALIALKYFRGRPEIDPNRVILAGRGLGAIVALLCGAFAADQVEKVVLTESLAAYQCLTDAFPNRWMPLPILNGVLKYMDLPDIVAELGEKAVVINPCDEMRRPLNEAAMMSCYADAMARNAKIVLTADPTNAFLTACLGHS